MARLARYFLEGHAQHIIQRGNNRELIFADTQDYHFYLEKGRPRTEPIEK